MKISQIIKQLGELKDKEGDLDIQTSMGTDNEGKIFTAPMKTSSETLHRIHIKAEFSVDVEASCIYYAREAAVKKAQDMLLESTQGMHLKEGGKSFTRVEVNDRWPIHRKRPDGLWENLLPGTKF